MAVKGIDVVKMVTERFIVYMDTPKEVRRERRKAKEHWSSRWFGYIPFSLQLARGRTKREQEENPPSS